MLVVLVLVVAAASYYVSVLLTTPSDPWSTFDKQVQAADDSSVTLAWDADTDLQGRHALLWADGHALLGERLATDGERGAGTVTLAVEDVTRGELSAPLDVAWYSWFYEGDPTAVGVDFETVTPTSDVGDLPSWYVPGAGDIWVVLVHGLNGDRGEGLRILPALAQAQVPTVLIRYRNDPGVPTTDNRLRLGDTEWRDVEAAMRWASGQGAQRFVLYGFSDGGQVALQTLVRSSLADRIDGLVPDGPVVSWIPTLESRASVRSIPAFFGQTVGFVTERRLGIDIDDFDFVARADEIDVPVLIFHGPDDTVVDWEPSRDLAQQRPDVVTLEQIDRAGHTRSWNTDPARYEAAVGRFMVEVGTGQSAG